MPQISSENALSFFLTLPLANNTWPAQQAYIIEQVNDITGRDSFA